MGHLYSETPSTAAVSFRLSLSRADPRCSPISRIRQLSQYLAVMALKSCTEMSSVNVKNSSVLELKRRLKDGYFLCFLAEKRARWKVGRLASDRVRHGVENDLIMFWIQFFVVLPVCFRVLNKKGRPCLGQATRPSLLTLPHRVFDPGLTI